jgi:hypothetical protein
MSSLFYKKIAEKTNFENYALDCVMLKGSQITLINFTLIYVTYNYQLLLAIRQTQNPENENKRKFGL